MEKWITEVAEEYSQNSNDLLDEYYHTWFYHIVPMWKEFCYNRDVIMKAYPDLNVDVLRYSIIFHDVFYKVGEKMNEEFSADIAKIMLSDNGVDKETIDAVVDVILSTKVSNNNFDSNEKKIMHDLDWLGFSNYHKMIKNEERIINEAIRDGFTVKQAQDGQKKFYEMIKDKDIYVSVPYMKYNREAKENIYRRLKEI